MCYLSAGKNQWLLESFILFLKTKTNFLYWLLVVKFIHFILIITFRYLLTGDISILYFDINFYKADSSGVSEAYKTYMMKVLNQVSYKL